MPTRTESISNAYRKRAADVKAANEAAAPTAETGKFEPDVVLDEESTEEDGDELPDKSWKKGDIVDWLVDGGIEVDSAELDKMTKAELLDRFIDNEG